MASKGKPDHVERVYDDFVEVVCGDPRRQKRLMTLGAERRLMKGKRWILRFDPDQQLATLFQTLRNMQVVFAGGDSVRPPSAVYEDLRENGLLNGTFVEMVERAGEVKTVER